MYFGGGSLACVQRLSRSLKWERSTCGGVGVVAEEEKLVRTTSWFPPRPRPAPRPVVEVEDESRELKLGRYSISKR